MYYFFFYVVLWALLSGGTGWELGLLFILTATVASLYLRTPLWNLHLRYLPGFLVFFIRSLWSGGWDVARRACHPSLPLNPGWVDYRLTQNHPRVSLVLSAMVGLLPGTLATRIDQQHMTIHVLNLDQPWQPTVERLEQKLTYLIEGKRE